MQGDNHKDFFQVILNLSFPSCWVIRKPLSTLNKLATLDPHKLGSNSVVLSWGQLWLPRDFWPCLKIFWVVITQVRDAPDIQWIETRDAAKRPTMHKTAPATKLSSSKCQWCQVGEIQISDCLEGMGNLTQFLNNEQDLSLNFQPNSTQESPQNSVVSSHPHEKSEYLKPWCHPWMMGTLGSVLPEGTSTSGSFGK